MASCLDYFRVLASSGEDPFMAEVQAAYDERFPGKAREWPWAPHAIFAQGTAEMYRSYRLWEAAVKEAGSVARDESPPRSITRGSSTVRAARPRWCPAPATAA